MTETQRFAAPSPDSDEIEAVDSKDLADVADLDDLFERWSYWRATRRFYVPPQAVGNILGKMSAKSRPFRKTGGPDAPCSTTLSALHLAILGQPMDAMDTKVFWLYYGYRTMHIKQVAAELGISRQHFYRLLKSFGVRVVTAARVIEEENTRFGDALPHRRGVEVSE